MKPPINLKLCCIIAALFTVAPTTFAQSYNWLSWTFPTSQTASANAPGYGSVGVSVQGPATTTESFAIRFDNVPFTPTNVASVSAGNLNGLQVWTTQIDFTSFSDTTAVILGVGNFGHGTTDYPGYRLTAFDRLGAPMPLTGFTQIGSYDHTWISPGPVGFNDDVSLNPNTGDFNVTTVPGLNENNSDILLLSLPAGVGKLSIAPIAPSGGDSINVVIAVPDLPHLNIGALGGQQVQITWNTNHPNYNLESASTLPAINWEPVTNSVVIAGQQFSVAVGAGEARRFFRLRKN